MSAETSRPPKFRLGDHVRVDDREPLGHCRAPHFIRGRTGTVVTIQGAFRDPERLAYHRPGLPALTLYKVRFDQCVLWPDYSGPERDRLELDIYENWLEPAPTT
ncbi:MAG: nitrile hydratase subunit beta [Alphaproteobacteria bacterium]|nr:nitrile hydratase subunit beta [Alphaproteobacteria bacterium]